MIRALYDAAGRLATCVSRVAPRESQHKLVRTFAMRDGLVERYEAWGRSARDPRRPLLWIHAPSVGEGLMALPLVQRTRAELPDVQLAYTYFSPSAERFASRLGADFTDYLPFDTTSEMTRVVAALRPTALVFSKLDVWPGLVECAHHAGVSLGLISASMPERSRRHGIGAMITRNAYHTLDLVGAASDDDARRIVAAGAHPERVRVTGDTRYDQAWERARQAPQNIDVVDALRSARPTLVAGSTWPTDEAELCPAWERVKQALSRARLIIAPHEIHETHLRALEQWATKHAFTHARLGSQQAATADVVIVDRIGVLADLYALATAAYVGGGFHAAGLHSVVEPAVFHAPTLIGPRHDASRDAVTMRDAGGITVVPNATAIASTLQQLFESPDARERMSHALADVVSRELGAVSRSFEIVRTLLGRV